MSRRLRSVDGSGSEPFGKKARLVVPTGDRQPKLVVPTGEDRQPKLVVPDEGDRQPKLVVPDEGNRQPKLVVPDEGDRQPKLVVPSGGQQPTLVDNLGGAVAQLSLGGPVLFGFDLKSDEVCLGLFDPDEVSAYDAVHEVCKELDWSWLDRGDNVLIKVACNSGEFHPAVTSPTAVRAVCAELRARGAKKIWVGDQAGLEWVGKGTNATTKQEVTRGSTIRLMQENGLMEAIVESKAEPVAFEELGFVQAGLKDYTHKWGGDVPGISTCVSAVGQHKVHHIIYLPRLGSHCIAGFSGGLKCGVGWLDQASRVALHTAGQDFHARYVDVNYAPAIADKHRLTLTLANHTLLDWGPDYGTIYPTKPMPIVIASHHLWRHDAVAWATFAWVRSQMKQVPELKRFTWKKNIDAIEAVSKSAAADIGLMPLLLNGKLTNTTILAYGETFGGNTASTNSLGVSLAVVNASFMLLVGYIEEKLNNQWPWSETGSNLTSQLIACINKTGCNLPDIPYQKLESMSLADVPALAYRPPWPDVPSKQTTSVRILGCPGDYSPFQSLPGHLAKYKGPAAAQSFAVNQIAYYPYGPKTVTDEQQYQGPWPVVPTPIPSPPLPSAPGPGYPVRTKESG